MRRMIPDKQWKDALADIDVLKEKGVYFYEVDNIEQLSDAECNMLRCGDVLLKKTANQRHAYRVSYKENGVGMCLTYVDCENAETIAYDYTDGHWVFNSKDVTSLGGHTDAEIKALAKAEVESASAGTIADSLGLDASGNLVKGSIEAECYQHNINVYDGSRYHRFIIVNKSSTPFTFSTLRAWIYDKGFISQIKTFDIPFFTYNKVSSSPLEIDFYKAIGLFSETGSSLKARITYNTLKQDGDTKTMSLTTDSFYTKTLESTAFSDEVI